MDASEDLEARPQAVAPEHAEPQAVHAVLAAQLSPAALRVAIDTEPGYNVPLHEHLNRELGLGRLIVQAGPDGRDREDGASPARMEAAEMHIELGRALYPGPLLPTGVAAAALVAADSGAAGYWLPKLADGSVTGTVAAADAEGRWSAAGVQAEPPTPEADSWLLTGRRWFVLAGPVADLIVVPALTPAGPVLFLTHRRAVGVSMSRQLSIDATRRIWITSFESTPAYPLGGDAGAALAHAEAELQLGMAAEAAGGIGWCLDAALEYVKDREQFGRPVGSAGAVALGCAEMLTDFESISAAVRYAAIQGDSAVPAVAAQAAGAYRRATASAVDLFGEVTWEHDAHLYYRRAWSAERLTTTGASG